LAALDALTSLQMRIELRRILATERHTCLLITHDVEEAIHLADRIIVLSPRPAMIQATFEVPFSATAQRGECGSRCAQGIDPPRIWVVARLLLSHSGFFKVSWRRLTNRPSQSSRRKPG
jgi:hypothetical protein